MADAKPVTRLEVLLRGARGRCPKCESSDMFKSALYLEEFCPDCGLPLEHEDGWGLGAIPLNYALTCLLWILPLGIVFLLGGLGLTLTLILAGTGAVTIPFLTFRFSKGLWIGIYYAVLIHELQQAKKKAPAEQAP